MDLEKLIYVIVGAIIGFALSLAKDWLIESKKNKIKKAIYRNERLEELYVLVGNWSNKLLGNSLSLLSVMHNKIHYNDYYDIVMDSSQERTYDFNRLEMILNIYAPELKDIYHNVIQARGSLNDIEGKHKQSYTRGNMDGRAFVNDYIKAQDTFENEIKILQENIAKLCV